MKEHTLKKLKGRRILTAGLFQLITMFLAGVWSRGQPAQAATDEDGNRIVRAYCWKTKDNFKNYLATGKTRKGVAWSAYA